MEKCLETAHKEKLGSHWFFGTEGWYFDEKKQADQEKVFENADCGFRPVRCCL